MFTLCGHGFGRSLDLETSNIEQIAENIVTIGISASKNPGGGGRK
jgi:hypothetical protein